MTKKRFPAKLIAINIAFMICILGAIEIFSSILLYNKRQYTNIATNEKPADTWRFELHPSVGHAHIAADFKENPNAINSISKNRLYTEKLYTNNAENKLVHYLMLGGSTTDPLGSQFSGKMGTWPDQLAKRIQSAHSSFSIINAGAGASTSSQELLRLITILQERSIDHVISLNGINELYFSEDKYYKNPENVLASKMVLQGIDSGHLKAGEKLFGDTILRSISNAVEQSSAYQILALSIHKSIGNKNSSKSKESKQDIDRTSHSLTNSQMRAINRSVITWHKNAKIMHLTSKELGPSSYTLFLQPTYGIDMSLEDLQHARIGSSTHSDTFIARMTSSEYLAKINYLYSKFREKCSNMKYCVDLSTSKKLTSDQSLYKDYRHLNAKGNSLLSDLIFSYLVGR